jgi:hypothetical protein
MTFAPSQEYAVTSGYLAPMWAMTFHRNNLALKGKAVPHPRNRRLY